ncbi:hypothetical protein FS749_008941, partial [Ceratobasidium sp. UAMH 11750]
MSSRRTLSVVERELLQKITTLTENLESEELAHQLRELKLLLNSPDHDANDLVACSGRILEYMGNSSDQPLSSGDSSELVRRLNASRHLWASVADHGNKAGKGDPGLANYVSSHSASTTTVPNNDSESNTTRISYPLSADTYRLLQDTQFLYRLSNIPESASHPDQSILSLMRSSSLRTGEAQSAGPHNALEETVKRAYWDQMKEVLSHDDPKHHIDQLKALYKDLSEATSRFFPPGHPLYALFKCPLAPTTHPLETAVYNMGLLVAGLRERCAPIRDETLIAIQQTLNTTLPSSIVDAAESIIQVAELMRGDLDDYVLQNASEEDAKGWVRAQARVKEREVALRISGTQEKLVQSWKDYLNVETISVSRTLLARRLLETVSSPIAALFLPPAIRTPAPQNQNIVPPQLMLSVDSLVKVQDLIQAVVIVASLRSLIPISPDFTSRIWALVESAIVDPGTSSEPRLKLINLQDEVIEAYRTHATPHTPIPDETLRATVSRTLRTEDPVFLLLQKRLVSALEAELVQPASGG